MKSVINATFIIAINTLISVRLHATALSNHDCNLDQRPQCFFLFLNCSSVDTFPSGFPSIRFGHECAIYYNINGCSFRDSLFDISIFNPHPLFRESHQKPCLNLFCTECPNDNIKCIILPALNVYIKMLHTRVLVSKLLFCIHLANLFFIVIF